VKKGDPIAFQFE
jgi:Ca2+-binding EF-hand superfamily protein